MSELDEAARLSIADWWKGLTSEDRRAVSNVLSGTHPLSDPAYAIVEGGPFTVIVTRAGNDEPRFAVQDRAASYIAALPPVLANGGYDPRREVRFHNGSANGLVRKMYAWPDPDPLHLLVDEDITRGEPEVYVRIDPMAKEGGPVHYAYLRRASEEGDLPPDYVILPRPFAGPA